MGMTGYPAGKFIAAITYKDGRPRTWTEGPWSGVLADLLHLDPASIQNVNLSSIIAELNPADPETRIMTHRADLVQCPHDEWCVRVAAEDGETVAGWLPAGQSGPGQYTPAIGERARAELAARGWRILADWTPAGDERMLTSPAEPS